MKINRFATVTIVTMILSSVIFAYVDSAFARHVPSGRRGAPSRTQGGGSRFTDGVETGAKIKLTKPPKGERQGWGC